jgi:hypothetical protein
MKLKNFSETELNNTMKIQTICFLLLVILLIKYSAVNAQQNWSPEQVFYGKGGSLTYTPDGEGNTIPDFSNVGYRYGDENIPDIPVVIEVTPVEGDDGATIQAAIDKVAEMTLNDNGFRGAVLLKAGTYQIAGQLIINTSGIVLRGEGDTDDGTIVIAEGTDRRELIKIDNAASRIDLPNTSSVINESFVAIGRKYLVLSSTEGFAKGDDIIIFRPGTEKWISDIKMDQITPSEGTVQWNPSSYSFSFERKVTKISQDTIYFRNPIVMAIDSKYGGGSVYKYSFDRIKNIGIENLCLKSAYTSETDEDHSWTAIKFHSVENGWARNITSWYFAYACISLERKSKLITVDSCHCREPKSISTGGRRYSFNLAGSLNLFKNCTTTEGRHDFVTSSRVCGPNVFTSCEAANTHSDIGPHHRWAMGTLFDVITTDGTINVQDRDDMGTGHGWAGANQVFWNCTGASSTCQSPWASAKNYNFGFQGTKKEGARTGRPDGIWMGHNKPGIFPASLYEAQLDERINGTSLFSAMPDLLQVDDSVYNMSFTLPLDSILIIKENFIISGTAGVENKTYAVAQKDDYTVIITFNNIGLLPALSTIVVQASTITSKSGKAMKGLTEAFYTEPDKRPVVYATNVTVNNDDGFAEIASSKPGSVYLVKYTVPPNNKADLDSLVSINLGRKAQADIAEEPVAVHTNGLPGGYYRYYAVDMYGRISKATQRWVKVVETGPVTGLESETSKNPFKVYQVDNLIVVEPGNNDIYSLEIYGITGRLLYKEKQLAGKQYIDSIDHNGILVIRKITGANTETLKISKHY